MSKKKEISNAYDRFIQACLDMEWHVAIDGSSDVVQGVVVGTGKYIHDILDKHPNKNDFIVYSDDKSDNEEHIKSVME